MQSICPLRFQPPITMDTKKGAQKWHEGTKHPIRQLREQHYRAMTKVATLVPQTNLPEVPSYTEGQTLKAKGERVQEDHRGWFQKEGVLFLPGNLQWKLVNSLHTTNHLGENTLQRLLERSLRGTGLQMTIRQVLSSCPTCQLNNPPRSSKTPAGPACPMSWDLPRRGLADGLHPDASFSRV